MTDEIIKEYPITDEKGNEIGILRKAYTSEDVIDWMRIIFKTPYYLEREEVDTPSAFPVCDYFVRIPSNDKELRIFFKPHDFQGVPRLETMFGYEDKLQLTQEYFFDYVDGLYSFVDGVSQVFPHLSGDCPYTQWLEPLRGVDRTLWELLVNRFSLMPEIVLFINKSGGCDET